jgi:tetratricopeptide (TPR) repeat protein
MDADFGDRLRTLRRSAGISQVELAGNQLSASYISLLEGGKRHPSAEVVQLLAERLRCTASDLADPVTREQSQRAQLEIAFAKLTLANGETEDARHRLEELLPSALADPQTADDVRYLLAEVYWRAGQYDAAIKALLPVFEHCVSGIGHLPLATVGLRLTRCYLEAGDLQAAIRHGESTLRLMAELGLESSDEYLRAAATLVMAYHHAGDLTHAGVWVSEMIEQAERRGHSPGQAALYWNAAVVAQTQGRLGDAVHLSERALALLSEQNSSRDLGVLYTTCAQLVLQVDPVQASQAVELLNRAQPLLDCFATDADRGEWEGVRALAALAQGEAIAAEEFARQALDTLAASIQPEGVKAQVSLGDALAAQGRAAEATASYLAAVETLQECPPGRRTAALWRELADRLAERGQPEAALTAYRQALDSAGVRAVARPRSGPRPDASGLPPAPLVTTEQATVT